MVDIFEAGPVVTCDLEKIRSIRHSQSRRAGVASEVRSRRIGP